MKKIAYKFAVAMIMMVAVSIVDTCQYNYADIGQKPELHES